MHTDWRYQLISWSDREGGATWFYRPSRIISLISIVLSSSIFWFDCSLSKHFHHRLLKNKLFISIRSIEQYRDAASPHIRDIAVRSYSVCAISYLVALIKAGQIGKRQKSPAGRLLIALTVYMYIYTIECLIELLNSVGFAQRILSSVWHNVEMLL